jgi:hypothetical protein
LWLAARIKKSVNPAAHGVHYECPALRVHFLFHHFIICTPIHLALAYLAKRATRLLGALVEKHLTPLLVIPSLSKLVIPSLIDVFEVRRKLKVLATLSACAVVFGLAMYSQQSA